MKKIYNILLIDDHPIIIEAYRSAFKLISKEDENIDFFIDSANTCDDAYTKINRVNSSQNYDLVFLDIRLPPSKNKKLLSGEDLGIEIKKLNPKCSIVVSTTFNDNYRIRSIIKSIDPDGFLIKNDITPDEIIRAINQVLYDPPYYSKSVIQLLRKEISNDFLLDDIDRKLLYELSLGTKTKDLPNIIPLSIAGIEKRKRHLKQVLNVSSQEDKELIQTAKEKGYI